MADWREVLDRLNVADFYKSEGIELRANKGLCPFHPDTHVSLSVEPNKGLFKCHACGASGSVFDFYSRKHGVSFAAAVAAVSAFTGAAPITDKVVEVRKPDDAAIASQVRAWWVNLRRTPAALTYLREKRGLTDDTIERELIGWTGKRYSIPIRVDGRVVNAKLYDPHASAGDKMIWHSAGTKAPLYVPLANADIENDMAVVVEGELDALVGSQLGLITYSGTAGARTWKDEWNAGIKEKYVVTLYDADEAGAEGAQVAARSLTRSGKVVGIAQWTEPVASGYDLTDLIVVDRGSLPDLTALVAGAAPYVLASGPLAEASPPTEPEPPTPVEEATPQANVIPIFDFKSAGAVIKLWEATSPSDLMEQLRPLYPQMAKWSRAEIQLFYSGPLREQFKLKKDQVAALMSEVNEFRRMAERAKKIGHVPGAIITDRGESDEYVLSDFKQIALGQAWMDDRLYYTVTRGVIVKEVMPDFTTVERPAFEAVFISQDGLMKADPTELAREKFYLSGAKPTVDFNEGWRSDPRIEGSWGWYLRNKEKARAFADPYVLYKDIRAVLSTYCHFPEPAVYDLLTCYVMLSYTYKCFRSLGYVWLRALRGSGKTTVLDIMRCLGFNALKVLDPSNAFLFRQIAATSPMLLIDEAEKMSSTTSDSAKDLRYLLNGGYQAGTAVGRIEKDAATGQMVSVKFDVYGPKVLASIADPEPTLADRCVVIDMERSPKQLPEFPNDTSHPRWMELRDRLHVFGLTYAKDVNEIREIMSFTDAGDPKSVYAERMGDVLRNRERQVFAPLLSVALLVDTVNGTAWRFDTILNFARQYILQKQDAAAEETDFMVLMAVRHFVRQRSSQEWFNSADLLKHVRSVEGVFERYSAKRLYGLLANKVKALREREKKGHDRAMSYRLDRAVLEAKCRAYMLPEEDVLSFREVPVGPVVEVEPEEPADPMEQAWLHVEANR